MKKHWQQAIACILSIAMIQTGSLSFLFDSKLSFGAAFEQNFRDEKIAQTFTAPYDGVYLLEAWGAQGQNGWTQGIVDDYNPVVAEPGVVRGGYGGYAKGFYKMTAGQKLYIYTGSQNGWNGGGYGIVGPGESFGGGATDFRTTMANIANPALGRETRILVAGGGGAGHDQRMYYHSSNTGGNADGGIGGRYYAIEGGKPGTQTAGGAGGTYVTQGVPFETSTTPGKPGTLGEGGASSDGKGARGGGGYYGGGGGSYGGLLLAGQISRLGYSMGGGGSSYVGGVLNGSIGAATQQGHGKAKVTYMEAPVLTLVGANPVKINVDKTYTPKFTLVNPRGVATRYQFYVDGVAHGTQGTANNTTISQEISAPIPIEANKLTEGNHTISVRLDDGVYTTLESSMTLFVSKVPDAKIPVLSLNRYGSNYIDLKVSDTNDATTLYKIKVNNQYVDSSGALVSSEQFFPLATKAIRVKGLSPYTKYTLQASAKSQTGLMLESPLSSPLILTTYSLPANAPNGFKVEQVDNNTIQLSWDRIAGVEQYQIEYAKTKGQDGDLSSLVNYAKNKVITSNGTLSNPRYATDGVSNNQQQLTSIGTGLKYMTIDLGKQISLGQIKIVRNISGPRTYKDLIVQSSKTADFSSGVTTVFNNDKDNSAGLGIGLDAEYVEVAEGRTISCTTSDVRYIRVYSNGSNVDADNQFAEVEALGYPDAQVVDTNDNTYLLKNLEAGIGYDFTVRGKSVDGVLGLRTSTLSLTPKMKNISTPKGLKAVYGTDNEIKLAWDLVPDATGYDVERNGTIIAKDCPENAFVVSYLMPNERSLFRVRAKSDGAVSKWTEVYYRYTTISTAFNTTVSSLPPTDVYTTSIPNTTGGGTQEKVTGIEAGPVPGSDTWKFTKTGTTDQENAWSWHFNGLFSSKKGDVWEISGYYKTNASAGKTAFENTVFLKDNWVDAYKTTTLSSQMTITADGQWRPFSVSIRADEDMTNPIIKNAPGWGASKEKGVLYINGLRWRKIPADLVNMPITIDGNTNDWSGIRTLSTNVGGTVSLKMLQSSQKLYVVAAGVDTSKSVDIYLNTDSNNSTGYTENIWRKEGADYLIQGNALKKYSGTGKDWTWAQIGTVAFAKSTNVAEMGVDLSQIQVASGASVRGAMNIEAVMTLPALGESMVAAVADTGGMDTVTSMKSNQIALTWQGVTGAMAYQLEADGEMVYEGKNPTYLHKGLKPESQHSYRVRVKNLGGWGPWSNILTLMTTSGIPTKAPEGIVTTATDESIAISWKPLDEAEGYEVVEIIGGQPGQILDNGKGTTCLKRAVKPGTTHTYRVRGKNIIGEGPWSSDITVTTYKLPTPVVTNSVERDSAIIVEWAPSEDAANSFVPRFDAMDLSETNAAVTTGSAVSSGASGSSGTPAPTYELKVEGPAGTQITGFSQNYTVLTGLAPETRYTVSVRTLGGSPAPADGSAWSKPVPIFTTPVRPLVPQNVSATVTDTTITMSWDAVAGAVGYDIELDGVLLENDGDNKYTHEELEPLTLHKYRVRAQNGLVEGDWSAMKTIRTMPAAPVPPKDITIKSTVTSALIQWPAIPGALGYDVEITNDTEVTLIENINKNYFLHRKVGEGKEMRYRIRTRNIQGESEWTGIIVNNAIKAICTKQGTLDLGLTAHDVVDFKKYTMVVTYNQGVVDVEDLSTKTGDIELIPGKIEGTDITIVAFEPGRIVFKCDKAVEPDESWTGVINSIKFKAKHKGGTTITYTVHVDK